MSIHSTLQKMKFGSPTLISTQHYMRITKNMVFGGIIDKPLGKK